MKNNITEHSLGSPSAYSRNPRLGSTGRRRSALTARMILGSCLALLFLTASSSSGSPSASLKPAPVASPRVVLAEVMSGTWNWYEVHWSNPALRRIQEEEGPENFIVLAYHYTFPGSNTFVDPFHTQDSEDRRAFYSCCTQLPTIWFSARYEVENKGDTTIDLWYNYLKPFYEAVRRTTSPVEIALTGAITMEAEDEYQAEVEAVITATDRLRGRYLVWFVLSENALMAPGRLPPPHRLRMR